MIEKIYKLFQESHLEILDENKLNEYIKFCLDNDGNKVKHNTAYHHILPISEFPEFGDIKNEYKWNGSYLSHKDHYIAHSMIIDAIVSSSMMMAWFSMNFVDKGNGRINNPMGIIGEETYSRLMKLAKENQSEYLTKEYVDDEGNLTTEAKRRSKIMVNTRRNDIDDSGLDSYAIGARKGKQTKLKDIDENGLNGLERSSRKAAETMNKKQDNNKSIRTIAAKKMVDTRSKEVNGISSYKIGGQKAIETKRKDIDENGLNGLERSSRKGKQTKLKDIDENGLNGLERSSRKAAETKRNDVDENGLNAHQRQGQKMSKIIKEKGLLKGSKNPRAKRINIYNELDELMFECHGNFDIICSQNNLPSNLLRKSYKENKSISKPNKYTNKSKIEKLTKYVGWYAKEI